MEIDKGRPRPKSLAEAKLFTPRQAANHLSISTAELWRLNLPVEIRRGRKYFVADSVRRAAKVAA